MFAAPNQLEQSEASSEYSALAIVGSRHYDDYESVEREYRIFCERHGAPKTIVTGCANGADRLARKLAKANNITLAIKQADWAKHGRSAGPKRNALIVEQADFILAFPLADSKGTWNTLAQAKRANKPFHAVPFESASAP